MGAGGDVSISGGAWRILLAASSNVLRTLVYCGKWHAMTWRILLATSSNPPHFERLSLEMNGKVSKCVG